MLVAHHGSLNRFYARYLQHWHERLDGMRGPARLPKLAIHRLVMVISGFRLGLLARAAIVGRCRYRSLLVRTCLRSPCARSRAKRERDNEQKSEPKMAHHEAMLIPWWHAVKAAVVAF